MLAVLLLRARADRPGRAADRRHLGRRASCSCPEVAAGSDCRAPKGARRRADRQPAARLPRQARRRATGPPTVSSGSWRRPTGPSRRGGCRGSGGTRSWRGVALADFAYEPFAQPAIGRLEELRLLAIEKRIEADLALGRHAELVGELEELVAEHPLRERLRGQLMLALYRSGRQAEALAAYRAARRLLVDELGIEPSAGAPGARARDAAPGPGARARAGDRAGALDPGRIARRRFGGPCSRSPSRSPVRRRAR